MQLEQRVRVWHRDLALNARLNVPERDPKCEKLRKRTCTCALARGVALSHHATAKGELTPIAYPGEPNKRAGDSRRNQQRGCHVHRSAGLRSANGKRDALRLNAAIHASLATHVQRLAVAAGAVILGRVTRQIMRGKMLRN
jgi:hypothetical protein